MRNPMWLILLLTAAPLARAQVTNLQLAASQSAQNGPLVLFRVPEPDQGGIDLNGDGDAEDGVMHVRDEITGTVTNLRVAGSGASASGHLVAFAASELLQGNTDLNGDGDTSDFVAHVYDGSTGVLRNLELAVFECFSDPFFPCIQFLDPCAIIRVSEDSQGTDLNQDGDLDDQVLHAFDPRTGVTTNFSVASANCLPGRFSCAFTVAESAQGNADLNGDGDTEDQVIHSYDLRTAAVSNLGLVGRVFTVFEARLLCELSEPGSNTDFNGDGDQLDAILHVVDLDSGVVVQNLGTSGVAPNSARRLAAIKISEVEEQSDLNGDGDLTDSVVHALDLASGLLVNTGLALQTVDARWGALEDHLVIPVPEAEQGATDLNGDGDTADVVVHIVEASSGSRLNLGLACQPVFLRFGRRLVAFPVREPRQGGIDLNGDGDAADDVVHVYDTRAGTLTNTRLATRPSGFLSGFPVADVPGELAAFVADEHHQGTDLNQDGDTGDLVLHVFDATADQVTNLGLAVEITSPRPEIAQDRLRFLVREDRQGGTDLNQDGDADDPVLHLASVDLLPPCSRGTVNRGIGPAVAVLTVNGSSGSVFVPRGAPLTVSLDVSPAGPVPARYLLWVWPGPPRRPTSFIAAGSILGCLTNPTPLQPTLQPQPRLCVRTPALPGILCRGVSIVPGPNQAPWARTRNQGLDLSAKFTVQGILQDDGSASFTGYSVTNALVITID